ncbi:hypothetical protein CROQUDRAFT_35480 [Cronartium quercuum f. sp. fusiforme G11]|uniref:Wax synthase domain-containing protein n=1 Tax=Cronartium quercuum f. sp. fusiforme G11 TaxID=708437 RepID=A0A9P6TJ13_9BASI|nr:hypothetical protein CROQUDRAFT_35480 [Cronartium quercuum f. sp. fusiforme G11]
MSLFPNTSSPSTPGSVVAGRAPLEDLSDSYCQPITASAFIPYILVILQCALLHPTFVNSKLARLIRVALTPINVIWAFMFPFRYCFRPLESLGQINMGLGSFALYTAIKSLEWGFASGPYYKRPLKIVDGVPKWEKVKKTDDTYKKMQEEEPCTAFKLFTWTLLMITSMRGLQFTWGPAITANTHSTSYLIGRFFRLGVPLTCALALIILTRDSPLGTPTSGLLSIGVPNFPGLTFLAECTYTVSFGVWLSCNMDIGYTFAVLLLTSLHKIANFLQCPPQILELCDPVYYPPMFNSPQRVHSIADLWGRAWHTFLQRIFLISGGKPVVWITQKFGASSKIQKLAGLFGIFGASAFVHEYITFVLAQAPHPNPKTLTSFPGSAIFFMLQPLAILVEPFIIPLVPKTIGGGTFWVWAFSTVAAYTFRAQYLTKDGIIGNFPPLSQWSWLYILSPIKY